MNEKQYSKDVIDAFETGKCPEHMDEEACEALQDKLPSYGDDTVCVECWKVALEGKKEK